MKLQTQNHSMSNTLCSPASQSTYNRHSDTEELWPTGEASHILYMRFNNRRDDELPAATHHGDRGGYPERSAGGCKRPRESVDRAPRPVGTAVRHEVGASRPASTGYG